MLSDLDELALSCRSSRSRQHLNEAILCYKAGAYRACIVATWIAVTFDLLDKLSELALAGDAQAKQLVDRFEAARSNANFKASLEFERGLLTEARQVDLISALELVDLERLSQDRNRCAHPSLLVDGETYAAPAELARLHVRNAVHHVMAQEPAQGKAALELLIREVESDYFPRTLEETQSILRSSALRRPKEALFSNFVAILLKSYLLKSPEAEAGLVKYLNALKVAKEMHPALWESALVANFSRCAARCETASEMSRVLGLLTEFGLDAWEALSEAQQIRVGTFVESLPPQHLRLLRNLKVPDLVSRMNARIASLRTVDLRTVSPFDTVPSSVFDRCVKLLRNAPGSQSAAEIVQFLIDHSDELSPAFVAEFLVATEQTQAIRRCGDRNQLYEALMLRSDFEADEIRNLILLSTDYLRFYKPDPPLTPTGRREAQQISASSDLEPRH